jgi:hypothetical protein
VVLRFHGKQIHDSTNQQILSESDLVGGGRQINKSANQQEPSHLLPGIHYFPANQQKMPSYEKQPPDSVTGADRLYAEK